MRRPSCPDAGRARAGPARRSGAVLVLLAALAALAGGAGPVGATPNAPTPPAQAALAQDPTRTFVGAPGEVVRFETADATIATTPTGRYTEVVEVRRAPGGDLLVINDVATETYVAGIAEMPARWPIEALKAQAVAARTYAWFQYRLGTFQDRGFGYDICATVACQVFAGVEVVQTPLVGDRWQQAVDETAGEVLLYEGAPILARYSSTNGGRIFANEEIFPSSGAYPYLVAGEDPDDAVSPVHAWDVVFTRDQLNAIMAEGRSLAAAVPFATIEDIPSDIPGLTRAVRVVGDNGTVVEVGAVDFRSFVSAVAPDLYPDDYPGPRADGQRPLPSTVPSSRFTVEVDGDTITLRGRGWGHGVGMGQWGAMGKAERGLTYDEILAAYYGGLTPTTSAALPARLRVGLQATQGPVAVELDGPTRVVLGDRELAPAAFGVWTVTRATNGSIEVTAQDGFGEPLVVGETLVDGGTSSRAHVVQGEVVALSVDLGRPALLLLELRAADGTAVVERTLGVVGRGTQTAEVALADPSGGALDPGTYALELRGTDETGAVAGTATSLLVRAWQPTGLPDLLGPAPASADDGLPVPLWWPAGAAGLLVGLGLAGRRPRRAPGLVGLAV